MASSLRLEHGCNQWFLVTRLGTTLVIQTWPQLTIEFRSKHYLYHSLLQMSFVNELSCYPLVCTGNHRKLPHHTWPSDWSYFTGATQSNLSSISLTVLIFRVRWSWLHINYMIQRFVSTMSTQNGCRAMMHGGCRSVSLHFDVVHTDVNQSQIPAGVTLLRTILLSNKTNISVLTGDRVAHPLLISLANIKMETRLKSSSWSFLLSVLLPVPKFIHKNSWIRGVLKNRLIHQCLDIVLDPLKHAAKLGIMLSDPWGHSRYCFMSIASYIIDTPKAAMLAGVGGKTSPVTMVMYKQFRDPFQHEPQTALTTLHQLVTLALKVDPNDVELYLHEALKFCLNGVHTLFWCNMALSCPSRFFNPEVLHYLHKEFWDHNIQWCINVLGTAEIDFRFSVLQPVTSFHHFREGISSLRQVTGQTHQDIQCTIIAVIAGSAPHDVVITLCALMDFHYWVQACQITVRWPLGQQQ